MAQDGPVHPHPRTDPVHRRVQRQTWLLLTGLLHKPLRPLSNSFGYFLGAGTPGD
jgi:hypothetical protein